MRLARVQTDNFKALRGSRSFDLPSGIIGIVGDNGQGKSTLTTAISWALFGPAVLGKKITSADTIHWDAESAGVSLDIDLNGELFELTRTQKKSGSDAHLRGPVSADGSDAVTKAIVDILGIDYVGFLASVFSRQKDLEGLASLTTGDRTKTVLRLRGLESITKGIETTSTTARELSRSLDSMRALVPNPKPQSEYNALIKKLQMQLNELDVEISTLKEERTAVSQEVNSLVSKQQSLAGQREAYLTYIREAAKAKSIYQAAVDTLEKAQRLAAEPLADAPRPPSVTADRKRFQSLTQKQASDREYVRTLIQTLTAKDTCPSCGRKYDNAEELAEHKAAAESEKSKADRRIAKREAEMASIEAAIKAEDAYVSAHEKWITVDRVRWQALQDAVGAAEKAVEQAQSVMQGIEPIRDISSDYEALVTSTREAQNREASLREKIATLEGRYDSLELQLEHLAEEREAAKQVGLNIKSFETQLLESTVTANLLKDFKSLQTERLAPDISAKASDLLAQLSDGKYSELILTPDWDIQYRYENGDVKGFQHLSVGERNTFALALRLALSDLRAANIGLLVLDEVLDAMDENRQNLTWGTLEGLLGRYEQIMMITHVAAFKERAPYIIQL